MERFFTIRQRLQHYHQLSPTQRNPLEFRELVDEIYASMEDDLSFAFSSLNRTEFKFEAGEDWGEYLATECIGSPSGLGLVTTVSSSRLSSAPTNGLSFSPVAVAGESLATRHDSMTYLIRTVAETDSSKAYLEARCQYDNNQFQTYMKINDDLKKDNEEAYKGAKELLENPKIAEYQKANTLLKEFLNNHVRNYPAVSKARSEQAMKMASSSFPETSVHPAWVLTDNAGNAGPSVSDRGA